jgi:homoserine O-acetyltransferase/O-succinyltransferase
VISVTSDWLYPPYQSKDIVQALVANNCDVQYTEIRSNFGHDAFLLESGQLTYHISRFLNHTLVRDIMNKDVPTVPEGTSISNAAEMMITKEINHLPVLSNQGTLTGIVTSWDIAKAVARSHHRLEDIMSRNVIAANPGDTIETAAKKMDEHTISALPVIDEGRKLIGIISSEMISTLIGRYK